MLSQEELSNIHRTLPTNVPTNVLTNPEPYLALAASTVFQAPILQHTSLTLDGIPLPVDGPCIAYPPSTLGHTFSTDDTCLR